jgi:hypothetical protein
MEFEPGACQTTEEGITSRHDSRFPSAAHKSRAILRSTAPTILINRSSAQQSAAIADDLRIVLWIRSCNLSTQQGFRIFVVCFLLWIMPPTDYFSDPDGLCCPARCVVRRCWFLHYCFFPHIDSLNYIHQAVLEQFLSAIRSLVPTYAY